MDSIENELSYRLLAPIIPPPPHASPPPRRDTKRFIVGFIKTIAIAVGITSFFIMAWIIISAYNNGYELTITINDYGEANREVAEIIILAPIVAIGGIIALIETILNKRLFIRNMPDKDGTGPRKSSYMYKTGHRGKKAGHQQGNCK